MPRDSATRGLAIILFGIAVMIFGAIEGPAFPTTASSIVGLIIAIVGVVDALTEPSRK